MYAIHENNTANVPAFLMKLWKLVEDETCNDLICWGVNGTSFHVYDQARFSREILPRYFKHNNIASFVRQLNMYGFRKVVNVDQGALKVEKDDLEFQHPYFLQGNEELLENIKRKISSSVKPESVKLKQEDVAKVLNDVHYMRGKQEGVAAKLDVIKRENEALWREVASLRQKHLKQQQIVNKLIQFLVTLVRGNRGLPTRKRKMPLMLNDSSQLADSKPPKIKRHLSIESNNEYTVQSPTATDLSFSPGGSSSPVIHDVTDTIGMPVTDLDTLVTDDENKITAMPDDLLAQASESPLTSTATVTPSVSTTGSGNRITFDKNEMNDQLDVLQSDLNGLKDLLSGGQYSLDSNILLGLFSPEIPLPSFTDTLLDNIDVSDNIKTEPETAGNICGHELIQYNPPDDIQNLFDLPEVGEDECDLMGNGCGADLNSFGDSDTLMTPPADTTKLDLSTPKISADELD